MNAKTDLERRRAGPSTRLRANMSRYWTHNFLGVLHGRSRVFEDSANTAGVPVVDLVYTGLDWLGSVNAVVLSSYLAGLGGMVQPDRCRLVDVGTREQARRTPGPKMKSHHPPRSCGFLTRLGLFGPISARQRLDLVGGRI